MTDRKDWEPPTEHDEPRDDVRSPQRATLPPPPVARAPAKPDVILLDKVSSSAPTDDAPRRSESAAGGIVVVATGKDADRVRKLCHKAGLLVPVLGSLAVAHDALSVLVIGEPSPPAAERVVHVVRPTIDDDRLLELLRALTGGRVLVDPPATPESAEPRALTAAKRLATLTDRGAIETLMIDTITGLVAADRAHCLFFDPNTNTLSSAKRAERAISGLVGWAAHTGHALHASPAGDDPRWLAEIDDPEGKAQSRVLVQPVIGADRRVHALLVAVRRWRHPDFTQRDRDVLGELAALAGPGLDLASASADKPRITKPGPIAAVRERPPTPPPPQDAAPTQRAPTDLSGAFAGPTPAGRVRPSDSAPPPKSRAREGELREVALVVPESELHRVSKLARKSRLEISTFATISEAPLHFRIVALGEKWSPETDERIDYIARASIADDHLVDLLVALAQDRALAEPPVLTRPQNAAEARRTQIAFGAARELANANELAAAETAITNALRAMLDTDRAYCLFFEPESGALWSEQRRAKTGDDRRAIAGIAGWAARTGRAANVPRASGDARWLAPIDDPEGDVNGQLLVQPLIGADQRTRGVMIAARRAKRPGFNELDGVLLARMAALVSPQLEQLMLRIDVRPLVGEETGLPTAAPAAEPAWLVLARTLPRYAYLALGALITLIIVLIARC